MGIFHLIDGRVYDRFREAAVMKRERLPQPLEDVLKLIVDLFFVKCVTLVQSYSN